MSSSSTDAIGSRNESENDFFTSCIMEVEDEMGSDENRYFRSVAYWQYIQLVYGYLKKRRIPLPACASTCMCHFQGYDDDEES